MAAIPMEELVKLEGKHKLSPDGLSYQHRCSRITAFEKGQPWTPPASAAPPRGAIAPSQPKYTPPHEMVKLHPLYGQKLLITPLMVPEKNRDIYFEEPVGHHIEVEELDGGALLQGNRDAAARMVGDYRIVNENPAKTIMAKTTLPKIGQEISYTIGKDLVPVVRGNDGQRGYVWAFPPHMHQVGDTMVQLYGLKTLIQTVAPELLDRFKGKPVMMYVDGYVLAASIPQTESILKEYRRKELQDAKLGLV